MIFLVAGCFLLLAGLIAWQFYSAVVERDKFATEREGWRAERSELLSRIQVPAAAPFLFEPDAKDADNDLPVLPPIADAEALEHAQRELESVGYEDGPAD